MTCVWHVTSSFQPPTDAPHPTQCAECHKRYTPHKQQQGVTCHTFNNASHAIRHMPHIQRCVTCHTHSTACHMPHILTCGPKLAATAAATAALSTRGVSLQVRGVEARHASHDTPHTSHVTHLHMLNTCPLVCLTSATMTHLYLHLHHQKKNQKPVLTLGVKPLTLQPNPTRELDPTPLCLTPCTTQYPQPCAGVNRNVVVKIRVALVEFLEHGGE